MLNGKFVEPACMFCGSHSTSIDTIRNDSGAYPPEQEWWECDECGEDWYIEKKSTNEKGGK